MNQPTATVVGALILGVALVVGAYQIAAPLESAREQLAGIQTAMETIAENPPTAVAAQPAAAPAPRRRGPDPAKQHEIAVGNAPVRGSAQAQVTIVEFSDFQCPFCKRVTPTLDKIKQEYGDKVRIAFKHMPLAFHQKAMPAHRASVAAGAQGKFWEMHDAIFKNQSNLSEAAYEGYAKELGLDVAQFKADMASPASQKQIDADKSEAATLGVTGTPSFFVNGYFLSGAQPYEAFKAKIDRELGDAA
ncbi:MAG: thioredoxin domain-containing protein [bacterium]|nr:thioredoxin domain-containing protein [bacterium]